jgi:hypothetical protein
MRLATPWSILGAMSRPLIVLSLAFVACCHGSGQSPPTGASAPRSQEPVNVTCGGEKYDAQLRATLTLTRPNYATGADVELDVAVENVSDTPVEVSPMVLVSQPLLLEVRDSAGAVVSAGPPPTPSEQTRVMAPHETVHNTLNLGASQSLPPGEYRVCARGLPSNTVTLRITGKLPSAQDP